MSQRSVPTVDFVPTPAADQNLGEVQTVQADRNQAFIAPPVFPNETKFDLSVLESSEFKLLKSYTPVTLGAGEVGRDDPFKPY